MIIKLLPDQVAKYWDYIRLGILATPSPTSTMSPEAIRNILKNILIGKVQCWALLGELEETADNPFYGFALTTIADDYVSGDRFLNIYDIYSFKQFTEEMWKDGIENLKKFARENNCNKITGYTLIRYKADRTCKGSATANRRWHPELLRWVWRGGPLASNCT